MVPMSPLLQESGLVSLLDDSDSELVIASGAFAKTLDRIRSRLPAIRADRWVLTDESDVHFGTYASFVANASEDEPPDAGRTSTATRSPSSSSRPSASCYENSAIPVKVAGRTLSADERPRNPARVEVVHRADN